MCGTCILLAEGILAGSGRDMLTPRLRWQVPLLTPGIAVVLDLFVDPVAVRAGYWVWLVPATLYYGIPLLNYVGWFVLMFLAPLAWILIARNRRWGLWRKAMIAFAALLTSVPGFGSTFAGAQQGDCSLRMAMSSTQPSGRQPLARPGNVPMEPPSKDAQTEHRNFPGRMPLSQLQGCIETWRQGRDLIIAQFSTASEPEVSADG